MVCPHCELAHPAGTTSCSRCGRALSAPDQEATVVFESSEATAAAFRTEPPAVASEVITPPPGGPQARTAVHFSGAFSFSLQPGDDFGPRYRIEALLGEGGMGTVYKAHDKELGRTVALKLVRPEFASIPTAMARFRQELLLSSKVSHKNVLRIHDLGDAGGMKFITMAYVEGQDLGKLMETGRLALERVLHFARQLCSALDAAHSEEVVHRDLKPNNILIDRTDNLYVMDFGLAKSFETDATMMTRTGQILGTPRYMAPEQVEAKPVDQRTDIYSLGLILYELATGEIPFRAQSTLQLMYQRVNDTPKDPRTVCPEVPEYLARIILKCLEREPARRYQSAREILADLDSQNAPPAVPPSSAAQTISIQIPRPSRRSWLAVAAVLAVALAALLAVPPSRHWILHRGRANASGTGGIQHYLAVLPLRVIGDEAQTRYMADGIVDSVSAKLGALSDLYVASPTAVAGAIKRNDPAKIARALGVRLLVQGTVQSSGDKIAVTISLDDVGNNGHNLFHQQFPGVRQDLLTLEDNVFDAVVNALAVKPKSEELARTALRPTQDVGAYDLYLKGRNTLRETQSPQNTQSAIGLFEQAVNLDHQFALAYSGLADAQLRMFGQTKDTVWAQRALGAAQRAEALNDSLPEVHSVLGSVLSRTGHTAEAVSELKGALRLSPNSDEVLRRLGGAYLAMGQRVDAIGAYQQAIKINPYLWMNFDALGAAYFKLGDNDQALSAYQKVSQLEPERASAYNAMGAVYYRQGNWNDAIRMWEKTTELQPSPLTYSNLGTTNYFLGRYNIAAQMYEKAAAISPNDARIEVNLGDAYWWAGQRDKATATFNKAVDLALKSLKANPNDTDIMGALSIAYAKNNNLPAALKFIEQARNLNRGSNDLMYQSATVLALAGHIPDAMASLSDALRNGYSLKEAQSDPELKALRQTPDFQRLEKELDGPRRK